MIDEELRAWRSPSRAVDLKGVDILADPDFKADKVRGETGVTYVKHSFRSSHQVKRDDGAMHSNRLYTEYRHKPGEKWVESGITKPVADFWTVVVGEVIIEFPSLLLQEACRKFYPTDFRDQKKGAVKSEAVAPLIGPLIAECSRITRSR